MRRPRFLDGVELARVRGPERGLGPVVEAERVGPGAEGGLEVRLRLGCGNFFFIS